MASRDSQMPSASTRGLSMTTHILGLLLFGAAFSWIPNITNPLHQGFGGSYQFLTFIGLTASTLTFWFALLADTFGSKQLLAAKNMLAILAASLEVLIGILYWSLRAIDKSLVVPPGHELPFLPDLGFHAMPAIVMTLDLILLGPPWTIKAHSAATLGSVFTLLYWAWIEYCFSRNGWYPYPLLMTLSVWQKSVLCAVIALLLTSSTMLLKWVSSLGNGAKGLKQDAFSPAKKD
ncbi:integral membrane protein [Thozetella sp. PMI_491]|nr:integral membrane protein [Thozetella sp. PMI_491]